MLIAIDPEHDPTERPSDAQRAFALKWSQHIATSLQIGNAQTLIARANIDRLKAGKGVSFPSTAADWGVGGY